MPEKIFGIRDNVPNTKNSYFQMSSTMSLIPKKKMSLIPNSVMVVSSLVSGRGVIVGGFLIVGGGSPGGNGWAGRRAQMSLLSLLRFARTQTRHGWR